MTASNYEFPSLRYFKFTRPLLGSSGVVHVEMHRPEKMNAFIEPMWLEMGSLFRGLSSDPTIRAIVLSGAHPSAFTTGLDTTGLTSNPLFTNTSFPSASNASPIDTNSTTTSTSSLDVKSSSPESPFPDPARRSQALRDHISTFQASLTSVATCNKPVIAAIHGYCLGLGVDLSLCADVRICSADTTFSVKEVDIGLAADVGTLSRLPKVVGGGHGSWVYDVCLSGRYFRAEEAAKVGFVSRVVEGGNDGRGGVAREGVVDEALKWAALVAEKSPVAVAGTKEILRWSWDKSVEDGLRYTSVWNSSMLQTEDMEEALTARMQKRRPNFSKL